MINFNNLDDFIAIYLHVKNELQINDSAIVLFKFLKAYIINNDQNLQCKI